MCTISIIVPVYNTQSYLEKCIESLMNQTFRDIEIICIDDCSSDNSKKILEQMSARIRELRLSITNKIKEHCRLENMVSTGQRENISCLLTAMIN